MPRTRHSFEEVLKGCDYPHDTKSARLRLRAYIKEKLVEEQVLKGSFLGGKC